MEQLFTLFSLNQKNLMRHLKKININYKKKGRKIIFNFQIMDKGFPVTIFFHQENKYIYIEGFSPTFIQRLRDYFEQNNYQLDLDNSNHPNDLISFIYVKEEEKIVVNSNESGCTLNITSNYKTFAPVKKEKTMLKRWGMYLGGGIAWGLFMFCCMGGGSGTGYTLAQFGIWMGGGLAWALFFGIAMEIIMHIVMAGGRDKQLKYKKRDDKYFSIEKPLDYTMEVKGVVINPTSKGHFVQYCSAKLYTCKENICILYVYKKQAYQKEISIEQIRKIMADQLCGINHDEIIFLFQSVEDRHAVIDFIYDALGFKKEEFIAFKNKILAAVIEYNPLQLIKDNQDISRVEPFVDTLAQNLYTIKEQLTLSIVTQAIEYAFFDCWSFDYQELAKLVLDYIERKESVDSSKENS